MIINNVERDKLNSFVQDGIMYEAVRKVLLAETEVDYTEVIKGISNNEDLGAKTRALAEGRNFIEKGFNRLLEFNKNKENTPKKNRAI